MSSLIDLRNSAKLDLMTRCGEIRKVPCEFAADWCRQQGGPLQGECVRREVDHCYIQQAHHFMAGYS